MPSAVRLAALAIVLGVATIDGQQQPADQQRPVFRAGAHFVRVDVYPTRNGAAIPGLKAEDFEVLEDNRPQAIETFEYIESPSWTPNAERRDPNSQRDGFELAKDPQYRVFVLYLDAYHVTFDGSYRARLPIVEFLNRMVGPRDLFGVLTPAQTVKDLLLGQLTQTIGEQLTRHSTWGIADRYEPQPGEQELEAAFYRNPALVRYLIALRRLDKVYADLEAIVDRLTDLREERKNVVFFSDTMPSPPSDFSKLTIDPNNGTGAPPPIGVSGVGTLTMAPPRGEIDARAADQERVRLTSIDFDARFRDLLRRARQGNVSFYTVRPGGLDMSYSLLSTGISNLVVLAEETDGVAVAASNDLRPGLKKVADDLSSHYVLGYYTTNNKWDGGTRKITVKLKSTGAKLRARREYRAPNEAEMAAIRDAGSRLAAGPAPVSPADTALDALKRLRPGAPFNAYGTASGSELTIVAEIAAAEIEGGRWKQGADVQVMLTADDGRTSSLKGRIDPGARGTLIRVPIGNQKGPWNAMVRISGDGTPQMDEVNVTRAAGSLLGGPTAFRAAAPASSPWRPIAAFHFRRTERLRIEWPALAPIQSQEARLLDRKGQPLAVPVAVTAQERDGSKFVTAELNLAPLSIGEYLVELTAKGDSAVDQKLVAIRVSMAR